MTIVRAMALADLPGVMVVEYLSFALPWSENSFRHELTENEKAHFWVAEADGQVIGSAGYWQIEDECHISTLAVLPDWRRKGVGELLLVAMLSEAQTLGVVLAILEVRVSNVAAIHLYEKYGFSINRRRKGYYRDNQEDALEMLAQPIRSL
jgi:ribosomal-protein-alanine N-acetyltransferase